MSRDFSTVVEDAPIEKKATRSPGIHFDPRRFISLRLPTVLLISAILAVPFSCLGWLLAPVEFSATAQFQYRTNKGGIADQTGTGITAGEYDKFVNTEIAKLTGDNVMTKVLEEPEIKDLPSIRAAQDPLTFLKSRVTARLLTKSELVNVVCTMGTHEEALKVLQHVADVYVKEASQEAKDEDILKVTTLNTEITNLEETMANRRKEIELLEGALGATPGGVNPQDSTEAEQYRASQLEAETRLKEAEKVVSGIEDRIAQLDALQASNRTNPEASIFDFNIETMVNGDPRVSGLQAQLVLLEGTVDSLRETHKEDHPALKAEVRKLETLRRNIDKQETIARADALKTLQADFAQQLEQAKSGQADEQLAWENSKARLDDFIKVEKENATEYSENRARLEKLKEEAATDSATIENYRTRVRNLQLDEKTGPRISMVTPPFAPPTQGITKKLLMAIIGVLAAFSMGTSFGVLRELLDGQIRTPHDIGRISSLPILASIPDFSEDPMLKGADTSLLIAHHPNSAVADEYRRVLARILFPEDNAAEISSLMVVSASREEGKTSVASNLAVALENANRRVLLIDLSSLRPGIEATFGLPPGLGLAELLDSTEAREDLIRRTAFENLGVIGPGLNPKALAGRLASREMMSFMEWADEHFDHIIIDTPPLLLMSDAKLIAPAIDGVLFVVGVGRSSLGMVSRGLRELELLRANTIGIVLNGIRNLRGGYLRQNQKLFYAYADTGSGEGFEKSMPEIKILDEEIPEPVEAEVVLLPFEKNKD